MKTTFDALSDTEIIPTTGAILTSLANDPELYNYILSLLPNRASLQDSHDRHQQSYNAALTGGHDQLAQRASDRRVVNRRFAAFATLVQLAAMEDATVAARVGLVDRAKTSASTPPLTPPANFKVWHGEEHGTMNSKCSSVKTAKSFEIHVCKGDPTNEDNWSFGCVSATCTGIIIKGLVPGTVYSFRIRAIRASGPGPWSSYVTLMAI
jgi:hypothetical protein